MIRILVVDDHPAVASGLRAALERDPELSVVGVAGTVRDGRAALSELKPDVAVLDIRLPDGSGFELIIPDTTTAYILISSFDHPSYIEAATRFGAQGFFSKTATTESIVAGIKTVAAGGVAFDPDILRKLQHAHWSPLTHRERQIVELLVHGRSNDEIAGDLGISTKTVEANLTRMFERYQTATRTELVLKAEREGWLYIPSTDPPRTGS